MSRLLALLLFLLPSLLVAQPHSWSPETQVSWSAGSQRSPAVVAVDRGFFGAWLEERGTTMPRVVVGRLRPGGGTAAVPVTASTSAQLEPIVASSGDVVLVAWLEPGHGRRLMIQRFSSFGMPLEEARSLGRAWSDNGKVAATIWDGSQFLVGWTDGDMRYVRISREGVILDPAPIVIPRSPRAESPYSWPQVNPSFATAGDVTLLVWQNSFRPLGTCIAGPCFPIPPPRIDGIRIDRSGLPIDAVPIRLSRGEGLGEEHPRTASLGDSFFVVWEGGLGIGGAEVQTDGTAGPAILYSSGGETVEALTAVADRYFILWRDSDGSGNDELFGSFLLPSQPWTGRVRISPLGVWANRYPSPLWQFHDGAAVGDENGSVVVLFTRVEPELAAARRVWQRIFGPVHEGRKRAVAR
ncbi:MAG: hypothetical protein LC732_07255 [Acidobacteria bacterium]|nr:hypothetical protein [Acidobacteriota bacterium]